MAEALRVDPGEIVRLYELIRDHRAAVEASLRFVGVDYRHWRMPGGGPSKLTTRLLVDLVDHLGVDSPLWAARFGEGFTHSQLVDMEAGRLAGPLGVLHPHHPASEHRAQAARAVQARDRSAYYDRLREQQERAAREREEVSDG